MDCKSRFFAPTIVWADLFYARCPLCNRMDLNGWTGKTFTNPPAWVAFKVALGARKLRCEYCRLNFASFRKRKEVFTFKRWKKFVPPAEVSGDPGKPESKGPGGNTNEGSVNSDHRPDKTRSASA
jgi:hypothetical protein